MWPGVSRLGWVAISSLAVLGCGEIARLPISARIGPRPTLPKPVRRLIPTINVARATGWPAGATPVATAGLSVSAFASGLDHPRFLYVLPNGDVLVAETNAPPKPDDNPGMKGWLFRRFQKKGGGGVPSANRITLLRPGAGDGVAAARTVFCQG